MVYEYWTDNWETPRKEAVEDEQNRRITKALEGLRCPVKGEIMRTRLVVLEESRRSIQDRNAGDPELQDDRLKEAYKTLGQAFFEVYKAEREFEERRKRNDPKRL